jgi:Icc-related predicted phosphoesterase
MYKSDPNLPSLNRFFVNDMSDRINAKKPKLWVHGHTHDSCDYIAGERTRVVCNPKGYPGEYGGNFTVNKFIAV